jgi:hypothetical protein
MRVLRAIAPFVLLWPFIAGRNLVAYHKREHDRAFFRTSLIFLFVTTLIWAAVWFTVAGVAWRAAF